MYRRNCEPELTAALTDTPVVLLNGARQTGKSTLATNLATGTPRTLVTLDDATALAAATQRSQGFIARLGARAVIDEAQKAPGLFPAIKLSVDRDRQPGRFLLTRYANILMLPRLSESLAGRMETLTLEPLSQGELHARETFIDALFAGDVSMSAAAGPNPKELVIAGGYPEALGRAPGKRRDAWFAAYLTALLQRDVRDLANIEGLTDMPRLLTLLAGRVGGLLNMSELSRSTAIPQTSLKRYLTLLKATFLFRPLPAWSANLGKRLIKSPKIHLIDAGLTAHLAGHTAESLTAIPSISAVCWRPSWSGRSASRPLGPTPGCACTTTAPPPGARWIWCWRMRQAGSQGSRSRPRALSPPRTLRAWTPWPRTAAAG